MNELTPCLLNKSELSSITSVGAQSSTSICHVHTDGLSVGRGAGPPFITLCGENINQLGQSADGALALSNYRLYLETVSGCQNIPLGLIEQCEVREMFYLYVYCKDARTVRCTFTDNEKCLEWFKQLHRALQPPRSLDKFFAFTFYEWASEDGGEITHTRLNDDFLTRCPENMFRAEVERLRFDTHGAWRISQVNADYRLCASYPPLLLVPACITDETLEAAARFRSFRRFPAVVWRHTGNGAVIARCGQPEVGWLGWRSTEDEDLLKAMADACTFDRGAQSMLDVAFSLDSNSCSNDDHSVTTNGTSDLTLARSKKVLIMDARSYTTALANRARGGGCECSEYYPSCDIIFMNLANIHAIRKSFHAVRQLCAAPADQPNWLSVLENTHWLQHMSGLLQAAVTLAAAVERDGRPVLVHCSDGWDRTPQIVALGELLLDPYYRTIEGFRVLCEREWSDFGHKFADRCGHTVSSCEPHERCPVFLQWLDCVHQLLQQYPCSFEFSQTYLVKLAQHTYSNLFGTFLCNTRQERSNERISEKTFSVWPFLRGQGFRNHLYSASTLKNRVLWPACNVRDLHLWVEVYLGSLENTTALSPDAGLRGGASTSATSAADPTSDPLPSVVSGGPSLGYMPKTRSYGDLVGAALETAPCARRSSDPNVIVESIKMTNLTLSDALDMEEMTTIKQSSSISSSPDRSKSPSPVHQPITVNGRVEVRSDVNGNAGEEESDNEEDMTEPSSDATLCPSNAAVASVVNNRVPTLAKLAMDVSVKSVDTSTETLVPENNVVMNGYNGAAVTTDNSMTPESCKVCAQNRKFLVDKHHSNQQQSHGSASTSGKNSRYSTPPLYSRTSSCPATPLSGGPPLSTQHGARPPHDVDGMVPLQSSIQIRLEQIVAEHKTKQEALERELHTTRLALIQQVCHSCSHHDPDKHDETCSLVGSVCSTGEGRASVNESLPSDMSWETLEEPAIMQNMSMIDGAPTLWVPDHAVTRCTGCHTEFWLGRRKHHCRNCGNIFCADCSENSTPLPNEQLYNPVRVCTSCFSQLRRTNNNTPIMNGDASSGPALDNCKHQNAQASRQQQQPKPVVTAALN